MSEASAALEELILADARIRRLIIGQAIHEAVRTSVGAKMRGERRQILSQTTKSGRAGVVVLANGLTAAILDTPLINGVRLRHATREDVLQAAQRYRGLSDDMSRKATWLDRIAMRLVPGQRVGDVIDDAVAARIYEDS